MLIQLNIVRAMAYDVPIPARYGSEISSLSVGRALFGFPGKLASGLAHRLFWRYFIYDISAVTLLMGAGSILLLFGASFGTYHWILGGLHRTLTSAGTVAIALLPILLGFQMVLQSVMLDIMDKPTVPLQVLLTDKSNSQPDSSNEI